MLIFHLYICFGDISIQICCSFKKLGCGTSLVVQWLRIRLAMQGTWVRSLVREDPTRCRAAKPVRYNYWAWALEPTSHNYWACAPQLLKPASPRTHELQLLKPMCSRAHVLQLLSPCDATTEARVPRACALQREANTVRSLCTATMSSPRSQLEKACAQQQRPNTAINK